MDRWMGKVAIVSGASSGIGAAMAKALVLTGIKVVGLARNVDRFEGLVKELTEKGKNDLLYTLKCDVSKEEDVLATLQWVDTNLGGVDILINNAAAYHHATTLIDGTTEAFEETINTNLLGPAVMTREVIQSMIRRNIDGHIVLLNSVCGHYVPHIPDFNLNIYCATKHAMVGYAETLRRELAAQKLKIKLSTITPGAVHTNIAPILAKTVAKNHILQPEDIADVLLYILSTPPHVQIEEVKVRAIFERF